ncbi:MAG TPA: glycosyltransferase [Pirellulales bacterium]|nr:glycosyltransferase [Pirellulales bacterium]
MHILFVHKTFPAQFGHIARRVVRRHGCRATFVSQMPPREVDGVECVQYKLQGGATDVTHYCSRTFENAVWNAHAVFEALRARPDIKPDLVVGHSGFGSTIYLRELYDAPIVNYFEYFYRAHQSDMDFRPDFPSPQIDLLRTYTRNAMLLADLENCDLGYSPTRWQRDRLPGMFHDKVRVVFDGVDTELWRRRPDAPRQVAGRGLPDDLKIVTYAARGLESLRGFDIFMRMARRICDRRGDVLFVVAGQDQICYGGDQKVIGGDSFKSWVLAQDAYDLARFAFVGFLPPSQLAQLFSISDLHVYLTAPFVLSWSLFDALACGATVLASNTPPVRELIEQGRTGLLVDFFDVDGLADAACHVLDNPEEFRALGTNAIELIRDKYSLDVCLPRQMELFEEAIGKRPRA